jgi:hypothetical protein
MTKSVRYIECPECDGEGLLPVKKRVAGDMTITLHDRCWMCGGKKRIKLPCDNWIPGPITLTIAFIVLALIAGLSITAIVTAF